MNPLFSSTTAVPTRVHEHAVHNRETRSYDCTEVAERCRIEYEQSLREESSEPKEAETIPDAVPTPLMDEPVTQPYPSDVYLQLMNQASKADVPLVPVVKKFESTRPFSLPGVRSARANMMELVLLLTGVVALPVLTVVSLQSLGQEQSPPVIARVAEPLPSDAVKTPLHNSVSVSHRDSTQPAQVLAPLEVEKVEPSKQVQKHMPVTPPLRGAPSKSANKSSASKQNKFPFEIEE